MNELRIPTVFAVGLWVASGLAVMTYTVVAFKETANGAQGAAILAGSPLVASAAILAAEQVAPEKPLDRGKFQGSGN